MLFDFLQQAFACKQSMCLMMMEKKMQNKLPPENPPCGGDQPEAPEADCSHTTAGQEHNRSGLPAQVIGTEAPLSGAFLLSPFYNRTVKPETSLQKKAETPKPGLPGIFTQQEVPESPAGELPAPLARKWFMELAAYRQQPCISIFLPVLAAATETHLQPHTLGFKTLLQEAATSLMAKKLQATTIRQLLQPGFQLLHEETFWLSLHHFHGLAVFIAPGVLRFCKLPFTVKAATYVNNCFWVTPLLPCRYPEPKGYLPALDAFYHLDGTRLASTREQEVIPAAFYAQVDTLLVQEGAHVWGRFDKEANLLTLQEAADDGIECLVNKAVIKTIVNGGEAYVLPATQMPGKSILAACMRY